MSTKPFLLDLSVALDVEPQLLSSAFDQMPCSQDAVSAYFIHQCKVSADETDAWLVTLQNFLPIIVAGLRRMEKSHCDTHLVPLINRLDNMVAALTPDPDLSHKTRSLLEELNGLSLQAAE